MKVKSLDNEAATHEVKGNFTRVSIKQRISTLSSKHNLPVSSSFYTVEVLFKKYFFLKNY
jgi:hypothetical protein